MTPPKIMLVHSGHSFSTSDVYDGLLWGLRSQGATVVEYRWDKSQQLLATLATAGAAQGLFDPEHGARLVESAMSLAGSDAVVKALAEDVDAVLVVNGLLFPASRAELLARYIPTACYGTEAPYMDYAERQILGAYGHWFTQERAAVARYQHLTPTTYLPLAYHPEHHQPGPVDPERRVDTVFVGGGYPERKRLLDGVNWEGIHHARVGTLWGLDLDALQGSRPEQMGGVYSAGNVPNTETTAWHRSARISLNMHRRMTSIETLGHIPVGSAESCNPRVYEVPAVGGFLLTDNGRPETPEILGDAAATYRDGDSADLERQIRYWLAHPDRREERAAAQRAAIAPHHYGARARVILETLIA
jgi:hypothetical protein